MRLRNFTAQLHLPADLGRVPASHRYQALRFLLVAVAEAATIPLGARAGVGSGQEAGAAVLLRRAVLGRRLVAAPEGGPPAHRLHGLAGAAGRLATPQLRALLRTATKGKRRVMFPMISDVSEVRAAKAMMEECSRELTAEGIDWAMPEIGIMVETPAAALCAAGRPIRLFCGSSN